MTSRPAPARGKRARFLWGAVVLLVAAACDRSSPTEPDAPRAACGPWPPQVNSPYDLPYPTGTAYVVNQGNCTPGTHAPGTRDDVGVVTSGTRSPVLRKNIALCRMAVQYAEEGTEVEVGKLDGHQKRIPATVVPFPFYDPKKTKPRS